MAAFSSTPCRRRSAPLEPPSPSECESDDDAASSTSQSSDLDEDAVNRRMTPYWCAYRALIESRGFRLDTCKDVKQWYQDYWARLASEGCAFTRDLPGYLRACRGQDENELCPDAGLPDRLFRGTQCSTAVKVVIKAVHLYSREYDVIRQLSCPPLRNHPMNHCIPVLDLIEVPKDKLAFIVMEEWSPCVSMEPTCNLGEFFSALRQCIEHIAFMHAHQIAHLDISIRNILTDYKGHYACIDYELSARYNSVDPRIQYLMATEVPPELDRGEASDPYKVDVYALGVLILHAMDLTGYNVPELYTVVKPMLCGRFDQRPTMREVLAAFNRMVSSLPTSRLALQGCRR